MPTDPELSSPEAQSFFTEAITSARLRVAFAESMLSAAQRELENARESLLRLETRREQLGLPEDIASTDGLEMPDDVSLLSDDHAHSVGSRSTMFIGSVGEEKSGGGFSLKNSIRNLRGKGVKNGGSDSRSVSSAPAAVKRNGSKEYIALSSPPGSPTKRSITPEPVESPEDNENTDNDNNEREKTITKTLFVETPSPSRTVSTAPTEQTQEDNEDTSRTVCSAPPEYTRENGDDARSRASSRSVALHKEDEPETMEYALFKQILKDHYNPLPKESKTESAEETSVNNFEPIHLDMVTMDTIIEEPADPEEGVSVVEVSNCGIQQINGSYLKFDSRDGVPTYSKIDKFESYETMFTISRWTAANGNRKWYITAIVPGQSPPIKSLFYVAYSASNVPPKEGWMVVDEGSDLFLTPEYTEKGVPAAPKLEWETDDGVASVARSHISKRSSVSNSHYYEVGQQVLNGLTRARSFD